MTNRNQLIGMAGTYFVAAELSRFGCVATVTSRNTKGIDILASNLDGSKTIGIQVKSSGDAIERYWDFDYGKITPNVAYVFVDLHETKKPNFYVLRGKDILKCTTDDIAACKKSNKKLEPMATSLEKRRSSSRPHFAIYNDNVAKKYLNKWKNLEL